MQCTPFPSCVLDRFFCVANRYHCIYLHRRRHSIQRSQLEARHCPERWRPSTDYSTLSCRLPALQTITSSLLTYRTCHSPTPELDTPSKVSHAVVRSSSFKILIFKSSALKMSQIFQIVSPQENKREAGVLWFDANQRMDSCYWTFFLLNWALQLGLRTTNYIYYDF